VGRPVGEPVAMRAGGGSSCPVCPPRRCCASKTPVALLPCSYPVVTSFLCDTSAAAGPASIRPVRTCPARSLPSIRPPAARARPGLKPVFGKVFWNLIGL
jgi:hypothetical protein